MYLYYMHVSVDFDPGSNSVVPNLFLAFLTSHIYSNPRDFFLRLCVFYDIIMNNN